MKLEKKKEFISKKYLGSRRTRLVNWMEVWNSMRERGWGLFQSKIEWYSMEKLSLVLDILIVKFLWKIQEVMSNTIQNIIMKIT